MTPLKTREVQGTGIGDKEGQVEFFQGVLAGITKDVGENHSTMYDFINDAGEHMNIWGSTTMDQRIFESDIGNFGTITFNGMGKSKAGRTFKDIEVQWWDGEPDERVAKWPGYKGGNDTVGTPTDEKDDDVPF